MKALITSLALTSFMTCTLISCHPEVDEALEMAEDNRSEMEQVLSHFPWYKDPLKHEAALFLIANMPFHTSSYGGVMQEYDSILELTAVQPLGKRDMFYKRMSDSLDFTKARKDYDIRQIKAEFLIRTIEEACNTWNQCPWKKNYSKEIFFNYVY